MPDLYIATPEALHDLCGRLRSSPWLAVDTEFLRERTYRAQLCLVQLSNRDEVAVIDPLAIDDLGPLLDLLHDPMIVKVLHAARQDLEIFHDIDGRVPQPLFDTQIAATLAGYGDQMGYADLVRQVLGVALDKSQTRTDWSARPLADEQLSYAADDVRHLGTLYETLRQKLDEGGRLAWLSDDFTALADPAKYRNDPDEAWHRVRGGGRLRGGQLAALRLLAAWRERRAAEANRPRRWIIDDAGLLTLAKSRPTRSEQLGRIRGLSDGLVRRHGSDLLELIRTSGDLPQEKPVEPRKTPLEPRQEALIDALTGLLRLSAAEHGVTVSALATRRDLEALVRGEHDIPLLHGWRHGLVGAELERFLAGGAVLRSSDRGLVLGPAQDAP